MKKSFVVTIDKFGACRALGESSLFDLNKQLDNGWSVEMLAQMGELAVLRVFWPACCVLPENVAELDFA